MNVQGLGLAALRSDRSAGRPANGAIAPAPTVHGVQGEGGGGRGESPAVMNPSRERQESTDQRDRADSSEPMLSQEPAESRERDEPMDAAERAEPTEPIDSTEPTDPIDSTEPTDPIDRIESLEQRER